MEPGGGQQFLSEHLDENVEWRKLHNEELHSLYRSSNIIRLIKSTKLRWAVHIASMGEGRKVNTKRKEGLDVGGRTIW